MLLLFTLFIIALVIIYFIIKNAIDNSQVAKQLIEIKQILKERLHENVLKEGQIEEDEIKGVLYDECPACHTKLSPEDKECPSCGLCIK